MLMLRLLSLQAVIVYLGYMHMTIIYLNEKHSYVIFEARGLFLKDEVVSRSDISSKRWTCFTVRDVNQRINFRLEKRERHVK